jgi:protein SCO1/2
MKKVNVALLAFVGVFVVSVFVAYSILKKDKSLPVYQPGDINPALVDESVRNNQDHHVLPFDLINQNGERITQEKYEGKIYVACFFFARCVTLCPELSKQFYRLQEYYGEQEEPLLISHSVTPQADSVSVLRAYADRFKVDDQRWDLVTGEKQHIYELARKSYFAVLDEGDGGMQDFIHTENFILVDREGRLRGFYDGTSTEEVNKLILDIEILQQSYEKQK